MPGLGLDGAIQAACHDPPRLRGDGAYVIADGDLVEAIAAATAGDGPDEVTSSAEGARLALLRRLLADPEGRFRPWMRADDAMIRRLRALGDAAPNFAEATALVLRAAQLSKAARSPMRLCPLVLCGPPGLGKSFYARRLGQALGTRVANLAGTLLTERGTITGLGTVWKSPRIGEIAKALLSCRTSMAVVCIDEVEKMRGLLSEDRPLDALLPLLEPETARAFVDDYLGVPARGDLVAYVMTANQVETLSAPLRDRVVVVEVPDLTEAERRLVVRRVFDDVNADHGGAFRMASDAGHPLTGVRTRRMRTVIALAMGYAVAARRRTLTAADLGQAVRLVEPVPQERPIGFGFRIR